MNRTHSGARQDFENGGLGQGLDWRCHQSSAPPIHFDIPLFPHRTKSVPLLYSSMSLFLSLCPFPFFQLLPLFLGPPAKLGGGVGGHCPRAPLLGTPLVTLRGDRVESFLNILSNGILMLKNEHQKLQETIKKWKKKKMIKMGQSWKRSPKTLWPKGLEIACISVSLVMRMECCNNKVPLFRSVPKKYWY